MPMRQLGSTDLTLSLLGLGTVKFGRNTNVKYPEAFEIPTQDDIIKLLELAKSQGINTLDTAPAYGDSESKLGKIFENTPDLARDKWVIITKAGEEHIDNKSNYNFNTNYINNSINNSLKNLNTDYIDILLIHSDGSDLEIAQNDSLWQLLEARKAMGDIRAYGVSSKTVDGGIKCLERSDLAMVTYRQDHLTEQAVLDYAAHNNKGIILKKVLNSGHDQNPAAALKFSANHPAVTNMIIGTINSKHLLANIKAVSD
ncbi:MAG: aldo/keto reductase [Gammaproteobacteria bacterium]|nr:aldo/keto reductase [Gammaproteobacteria bacterium]